MALNRSRDITKENLRATAALAMAFFEQTGLRELIDSKFDIDRRQKLTPGYAVKALIGDMVGHEGRRLLYYIANPFRSAPNGLLLGAKVNVRFLGDAAFSRDLDEILSRHTDSDLSDRPLSGPSFTSVQRDAFTTSAPITSKYLQSQSYQPVGLIRHE